ncbi:hypothetical protein EVAR_102004_1 [Eumeta japonica]|uniref:Uncharacterized protein n=1 Tax=Eumeta variegata TaxID=151549 RepID=A0A4C1SL16_EUMVA|nr:hypothetical protein EVAR_102004_1 [Eumeta japonica]
MLRAIDLELISQEKKMAELGAIYEELVQPARTLVTAARTVQRRRRTADGLKAHKRIQILRYGDTSTFLTPPVITAALLAQGGEKDLRQRK